MPNRLKTLFNGGTGLNPVLFITLPLIYTAIVSYTFFFMNPVNARIVYVVLTILSLLLPLAKRKGKYVILSYLLSALPWTLLYFFSKQNIVFQRDALPIYNFDIYQQAYNASGRISMLESRGQYVGSHIVSYVIDAVNAGNYQLTVICLISINLCLLFLISYVFFRTLKTASTFAVAHVLTSCLVLFSLSLNYIWILSDSRFFAVILFFLFCSLILRYGLNVNNKPLMGVVLALILGITITDFGVGVLVVVFSFIFAIKDKNWKVLIFSIPPIFYSVFYTSMVYISDVRNEVGKAVYTWVDVMLGGTNPGSGLSLHLGTAPIYDKIGEIIFTGSFFIVLASLALYSVQFLARRKTIRTAIMSTAEIMFLGFSSLSIFIYLANRITPAWSQTDTGIIAIYFAQISMPITLIPLSAALKRLSFSGSKFHSRKLFAFCFLFLVLLGSMSNVYAWSYPKSAADPITGAFDMENRHQEQVYSVYQLFHQYKVQPSNSSLSYSFVVSDLARVMYLQRLVYIDHIKFAYSLQYDDAHVFYSNLENALVNSKSSMDRLLVAVPDQPALETTILNSNILFSTGTEFLLTPI